MASPKIPARLSDLDVQVYLDDPARKQAFVTPMFDIIAPRYDDFTRLFSFGMDRRWKGEAMASCVEYCLTRELASPRVLDLATGTGDLAVGIAQMVPGACVTGVDASPEMIRMASRRRETIERSVRQRVALMVGDMCALSLEANSVDTVMASYGVRNVPDATTAVREMRRVMRPGGHLMLLDFYRPQSRLWRTLFLRYLSVAGNAVGWWWYRDPVIYGYIALSIDQFISWQQCSALLTANGFRVESVTRYLGGGVARHDAIAI